MRGTRFDIARVVVGTTTPLTIGTGGGTDTEDSICVSDANGLPTLPGSSIAGVLRAAIRAARGEDIAADLFGWAGPDRPPTAKGDGMASRLAVSWGQVHASDDTPVAFRADAPVVDPVLAFLAAGIHRDHVRIGARGTVESRGKHDATYVPTGARFTIELRLEAPQDGELSGLVDLLASPDVRLGGRTRRGFGAFKVVRAGVRRFDLSRATDRTEFARLPRALHQAVPSGLLPAWKPGKAVTALDVAEVNLVAEDLWIFGGGEPEREAHTRNGSAVKMVPVSEVVISWTDKGAQLAPAVSLVPGASVKGALRHRVAYHARRARKEWADASTDLAKLEPTPEECDLFGWVPTSGDGPQELRAGRVWFTDVYVGTEHTVDVPLDHVSIDRFTGGPMAGMLFSEAPLGRGGFTLRLAVAPAEADAVSRSAREALEEALNDLCNGRLALGAGANRGHGYFNGTWRWVNRGVQ